MFAKVLGQRVTQNADYKENKNVNLGCGNIANTRLFPAYFPIFPNLLSLFCTL